MTSTIHHRQLSLFRVACCLAGVLCAAPGHAGKGAGRGTAPGFCPTLLGDESYAEQVTGFVEVAGGPYLKIQLAISNVGVGDAKCACRAILSPPGKASWTAVDEGDRDDWSCSERGEPLFQVGECYVRGGKAFEMVAVVEGREMKIRYAAPPRLLPPPLHKTRGDDDNFHEISLVVPWAAADVSWTDSKGKKHRGKGYGYADHTRSTALPAELATNWMRFRAVGATGSLIILGRVPPGDGKAPVGWYWTQGASNPETFSSMDIKRLSKGWEIDVGSKLGTWHITSARRLHRFAPVEDLGFLGAVVRRVVGNPVTYIYKAQIVGPGFEKARTGILEVAPTNE